MTISLELDDHDLQRFLTTAAGFGSDRFGYVVTPNADHLIRYYDEIAFREKYAEAEYVLFDSRFLSYVIAITKGIRVPICTGSDLTVQLLTNVSQPTDRLVMIGGSEEQAAQLAEKFGLLNLRHMNPPMGFIRDPKEVEAVLQFVERNAPFRFCFLAVGCPQQEAVALELKRRGIARGLAFCIGASIDFVTGKEHRAPRLMQQLGTEWLFRLAQSPRRLGKRYLVRGPRVFGVLRRMNVRLRTR